MSEKIRRLLVAIYALVLMLVPLMVNVTASASPIINEYPINCPSSSSCGLGKVTSGPDGALWSTATSGSNGYIYRITTSGSMTSYQVSSGYVYPRSITTGPDGALWFTISGSGTGGIGRITTTGTFTEYPMGSQPSGITTGPDGALWFTDINTGMIGRVSTNGALTNNYQIPTADCPTGRCFPTNITTGLDGALWFTDFRSNYIYRISTSGDITEYPSSASTSGLYDIAAGPDGALWFTEYADGANVNQVGRVTTSGAVSLFSLPTAYSGSYGITSGPDGALWYTEGSSNKIGRLTTSGSITEYSVPSSASYPVDITTGSDGSLWFTNNYGIGQLNPIITIPSAPANLTAPSPVQNPYLSWDNVPGADSYNIYRSNTLIDSISANNTSYTDYLAPEGNNSYYVTAVNTAGESSPSNTVSVLVDRTAPVLGTPTWTNNPMTTTQTATVSVPVTDNLSSVAYGEYYLGTTDPGQGSGTPMTLGSSTMTASYSGLTPGIYTVNFRAEDNAGNWSPVTTDYLVVYNATQTSADGHSNKIVPVYGTDVLPGLIQAGQTDAAAFAFTVKYNNGTLDNSSKVHFAYNTGTNCNNPNKATNCHNTTLDSTSLDWMVVSGTNNSQATIQGTATLTIDGVTTTNPFRLIGIDGALLNPSTNDQFEIEIYAPGANPNTAQPIYFTNDAVTNGNVVVKG